MKPETARGLRRNVPRRRRAHGRTDVRAESARAELPGDPSLEGADLGEDADWSAELAEFDPAEFAEFLEADDTPIPVDPGFRERLRSQLWGMVRERADAARPRGVGRDPRSLVPPPDPKPRR